MRRISKVSAKVRRHNISEIEKVAAKCDPRSAITGPRSRKLGNARTAWQRDVEIQAAKRATGSKSGTPSPPRNFLKDRELSSHVPFEESVRRSVQRGAGDGAGMAPRELDWPKTCQRAIEPSAVAKDACPVGLDRCWLDELDRREAPVQLFQPRMPHGTVPWSAGVSLFCSDLQINRFSLQTL